MKKIIILISISLVALATALAATTFSRELKEKAILGDAAAMHELSVCYRMGTGVAKDLDKANYWLERAAQEGNPNALATLELLDNKTSLTEAKRRELAAMEQRERERLLKAKEEQRLAEEQRRQEELKKQVKKQTFTANGVSFTMVEVQGGTFTMGATSEQGGDAFGDEKPIHNVALSSYFIGETEVTQALWQAMMGKNPSKFKGNNNPVEQVSWDDCQEFLSRLNRITGERFRLPTEAEWEYAARGGNKSRGYKYSGNDNIYDVAWFEKNSNNESHPVATKLPNELGLYDMSGNVSEWCSDWYGSDYYANQSQTNPTGPGSGSYRIYRGGRWSFDARFCRVSNRGSQIPNYRSSVLGLRLAL